MIKHDTFNNQVSSRLTQNGPIFIIAIYMFAFFVFSSKLFRSFLQIVKQRTQKTSKIGFKNYRNNSKTLSEKG